MLKCTYFYPLKQAEGKKDGWILAHCGFYFTNWGLTVIDCPLVKGKDGKPTFISPPNKKHQKPGGPLLYVKLWSLDEAPFEKFQSDAKAAILTFCNEKNIPVPEELRREFC